MALQLTTNADLPQVGYMVLIDKLYNLSYVMILLSMVESVVAVRWHDAGREVAADRLDRGTLVLMLAACIATTIMVLLFHR